MKLLTPLCLVLPFIFLSQQENPTRKFEIGAAGETNVCLYCPGNQFNYKWDHFNEELVAPDAMDTGYRYINYSEIRATESRLNLSFQYKQQLKNPRIFFTPRISYSFGDGFYETQNWSKYSVAKTDTLSVQSSGLPVYLNQYQNENISYSYTSNMHTVTLGALLDYRFNRFFTFYTGLEFGLGFSTKNQVSRYYSKYEEGYELIVYENADHAEIRQSSQFMVSELQTYTVKNFVRTTVNLPIGMKVRLSNKANFLNHFLLSYEFRFQRISNYIQEVYQLNREYHSHILRLSYEF